MLETLLGDGEACGSVMVTASHLPPEYNGLKFFSKELGRGLNKREVKEVMAAAEAAAAAGARPDEAPTAEDAWRAAAGFSGRKEAYRFMDPYVDKLRRTIIDVAGGGDAKPLAGFKICVNAGNGAGGFFATKVLKPLGADVSSSVHLDPDGTFPAHPANPEDKAHVAATAEAVASSGADVGVMLDTDVDRCGLIDGARSPPEPVHQNRLVALCAAVALERDAGVIVTDPVTSGGMRDFIEARGGVHDRYKMGYRNVIDRAADTKPEPALLAIETSGHSAWKDNAFVDDGCYTAAKLLGRLARFRREEARPDAGLLDVLGDGLAEPAESIKVKMKVASLAAVPAAEEALCAALRAAAGAVDAWAVEPLESDVAGGTAAICKTLLDFMGDCEAAGVDIAPLRDVAAEAVDAAPTGGRAATAAPSNRTKAAAGGGSMGHFTSTADAFVGKERDFKAMGTSSGTDSLRSAPQASMGRWAFASTAGALSSNGRDFKAMPGWLGAAPRESAKAVPATAGPAMAALAYGGGDGWTPTGDAIAAAERLAASAERLVASVAHIVRNLRTAKQSAKGYVPPLGGRVAASAEGPAGGKDETPDKPAGEGFMDHFSSPAGSFKGKDDDSKAKSTSSGTPDWLSEAPAPTWTPTRKPAEGGTFTPAPATAAPVMPPPPRAPAAAIDETPDKPAGEGFMDHFASPAGSFKPATAAPVMPPPPRARPPPPRAPAAARDETPDKPAGEGFMDHFATTAGSFKGKDGDSKPKSTSSGTPDWLSEAPAPTWTPTRKPAAGGTNTPVPATAAPVRPPPPRTPAAAKDETPDKPAGEGFMDHFATTAPARPSPPRTPPAAPVRPSPPASPAAKDETPDKPAGEGFMDHFATTAGSFKGKDSGFKPATGASSGTPDWLSEAPAPTRGRPAKGPGGGKDDARQARRRGLHGPLRDDRGLVQGGHGGSVMPPPPSGRPAKGPGGGKDETPDKPAGEGFMDHFRGHGGSGHAASAKGAAAPAKGPGGGKDETPDKPAGEGFMDHFATTAGSFKGKDGESKPKSTSSGAPDWLSEAPAPTTSARPRASSGTDRLSAPPQPSFAAPPMASVAQPAFGGAQDHFATKDVDSGLMNDLEREVRETEELLRRLKAAQAAVAAGVDAASRASPAAKAVPAKAAGGGIMDRFATAGALKGMDRDSTRPAPLGPPSPNPPRPPPATAAAPPRRCRPATAAAAPRRCRPAAPPPPARARRRRRPAPPLLPRPRLRAVARCAASPSAGAYDYKTTIQSRRAEQAERRAAWLSGSAVGTPPPAATAAPAKAKADAAMAKADAAAKERQVVAACLADKAKADATARAKADAAAKARAYEDAKEATAATPALAATPVADRPPLVGFKGTDPGTWADQAERRAAWLSGTSAAAAAPATTAPPDKAAGDGYMDHFASSAGSLKGRGRAFKAKSTSSGTPDWLGAAPLASPAAAAAPARAAAPPAPARPPPPRARPPPPRAPAAVKDETPDKPAGEGFMDHFATAARSRARSVTSPATGASSGTPDWLGAAPPASPAATAAPVRPPPPRAPAVVKDETPDKPAGEGFMDHFATTAGSFKGKERDFKPATGASSGTPDWLSEAPAPTWTPTRKPAAGGTNTPAPATAAGQAAPPRAPAAAKDETPDKPAGEGFMDHFATTSSFKGKERDFKPPRAPRPGLLTGWARRRRRRCGHDGSGQAASAEGPCGGKGRNPDKPAGEGFMDHFATTAARSRARSAASAEGPAVVKDETPDKPAGEGFMDHFATTAGSFKGKDGDSKPKSTSSGTPDWLSEAPAPTPPPPRAPAAAKDETPDKPAGEGFMDHFATTSSFKGKERDFKPATGASSGTPDWLGAAPPASPAATTAPVRPPPPRAPAAVKDETPDKPAGEGFMDHFATAGSFKGKERDFKPATGASSGTPDWLGAAPAASPAAAAAPVRPPPPRAPAVVKDETPDKPAGEGFMDHFATTAGSFKGKDGDSKPKSTSSGTPDWLSEAPAPTRGAEARPSRPPGRGPARSGQGRPARYRRRQHARLQGRNPDKPAGEGFMDHFSSPAPSFKGKDRDFKAATGASSGTPDWLGAAPQASSAATPAPAKTAISPPRPVSASPAAPPAPARAAPAKATAGGSTRAFKDETPDKPAGEGFMDHFSSPAPSFKGKDRDFKAPPASPAAPPAPPGPPRQGYRPAAARAFKDETPTSPPARASWTTFVACALTAPAKAPAGGNSDRFALSSRAFKDETPDKPAGEGFMDHFSSPAPSFKGKDRRNPDKPAGEGFMDHFSSPAPSFKGKDRESKAKSTSSWTPDWLNPVQHASAAAALASAKDSGEKAAAGGSRDRFATTAGTFEGKDETPDKPAGEGYMDHFASPAGSFKGKDRDVKAATGASSGTPDSLGAAPPASPAAALASAEPAPAKAAVGVPIHPSTAGAFKGKPAGGSSTPAWFASEAEAAHKRDATITKTLFDFIGECEAAGVDTAPLKDVAAMVAGGPAVASR
ncbi:hypothetical protein JL722_12461 [Aureococcus anophagefferens]|nr:hypothetical protein JL722_12461 [Aureococcus anophagefferens]